MSSLPPVPDSFYWSTEKWGVALRCRPLEAIAPHLFTTRQLQLRDDDAWRPLSAALGVEHEGLRRLKQVHGNTVVLASRPDERLVSLREAWPEADAIVTCDSSLAVAVVAADCVPILLADRRTGAVGAAHAGWRGTAAGVAPATVIAMQREFGTRREDLVVALGPSIGACCYEVGTELVDAFASAGHARYLIDRWFLAPPAPRGSAERPRLRLDVAGANRDQLMLAGVPEEHIYVAGLCTAMNLDVLTSYRCEGERAGRLAGAIRSVTR